VFTPLKAAYAVIGTFAGTIRLSASVQVGRRTTQFGTSIVRDPGWTFSKRQVAALDVTWFTELVRIAA